MSTPRSDRCPLCHRKHKRTHQQNARLWLLYHAIADKVRPVGEAFSPESWHLYFKSRFLGADDVKMPNGKVQTIVRSTADLEVPEFAEYMDKVEHWAAERDVWLEDLG